MEAIPGEDGGGREMTVYAPANPTLRNDGENGDRPPGSVTTAFGADTTPEGFTQGDIAAPVSGNQDLTLQPYSEVTRGGANATLRTPPDGFASGSVYHLPLDPSTTLQILLYTEIVTTYHKTRYQVLTIQNQSIALVQMLIN